MATAKQVLAAGEALAGENEAITGANNTTVNKEAGLVGTAYCGGFVKYAQKHAGSTLLDGCSNPWYVPTLHSFMKAMGWPQVKTPQPGDIFIEGDDMHTGYCDEYIGNGYMLTLEGNYGHVKASKADARNGTGAFYEGIGFRKTSISGFIFFRPPYDENGKEPGPTPEPVKSPAEYVKDWQRWLGVTADGVPGAKTADANFAKMFVALVKAHPAQILQTGDFIMCIQGMLYAAGYDAGGLDGEFGYSMKTAVKKFQKAKGLEDDGVVGADTMAALIDGAFK